MKLALKDCVLAACRCCAEETAKQTMEEDVRLPDDCAPIRRVLKCAVVPNRGGVSLVGDRAGVSGTVDVRLIYVNDEDALDCCEAQFPLNAAVELGSLPQDAVVTAQASVEYVNCRVTTPRRCLVSAVIAVRFCAFIREETTLPQAAEGCGCETRTETLHCAALAGLSEKVFDLSETATLPAERAEIKKILSADGTLRISEQKAANGKILLKGEYALDVLYCTAQGKDTPERLTHVLPVSQVLDAPSADSGRPFDVSVTLCSLQTKVRPDSSGENRLLDLAVKLSAFTQVFDVCDREVIRDCYATDGALSATFDDVTFLLPLPRAELRAAVRVTPPLDGTVPSQVLDVRLFRSEARTQVHEKTLSVTSELTFRLLLRDSEGQTQYLERTVEAAAQTVLPKPCAAVEFSPVVGAENLQASVTDGNVELRFDFVAAGTLFAAKTRKVCTKLEAGEPFEQNEKSALTLCFAAKGASLWELAKKYRTTVQAIRIENELSGDVLSQETMLLIPSV